MSTLISSAVSGKKAAPKAAPRRRPAPAVAATPVAPPSPPPTQQTDTPGPTQSTHSSDTLARSQSARQTARDSPPATSAQPAASPQPAPRRDEDVAREPASTTDEQPTDVDKELPDLLATQPPNKRRQDEGPAKAAAPLSKRAKRSSARSNASVQATAQEEDRPRPATRASRTPQQDTQNEAQSSAAAAASSTQGTTTTRKAQTKRKPKRKSIAAVTEPDADAETAEQGDETEERPQSAPKRKRRRQKEAREARPETEGTNEDGEQEQEQEQSESEDEQPSDPELHEINIAKVTMYDLGRDKRHGKTSELGRKMAEIDWAEEARKRRQEETDQALASDQPAPSNDVRETTEGPSGTAEPQEHSPEDATNAADTVQLKIVNGQIVEDESSLTIDRRAQVEAEAQIGEPVEEENDLTTRINRTTWINDRRREVAERVPMWKTKSDPWTDEETERFYEALGSFGTDFFIISKMFAGKSRRQIKLKYLREEKVDLARINAAMMGKKTKPMMDLEKYATETGRDVEVFMKYDGLEHAGAVIEESLREKEMELRAAVETEEAQEAAGEAYARGKEKGGKRKGRKEKEKEGDGEKRVGRGRNKKAVPTLGGCGPVETDAGAAAGEGEG